MKLKFNQLRFSALYTGKEGGGEVNIWDGTLKEEMADLNGWMAVHEGIANNLTEEDNDLKNNLTQMEILIRERERLVREKKIHEDEGIVRMLLTNEANMRQ